MSLVTSKRLVLEGLHCTSCAMNIDFSLEDIKGVTSSKTNYAKQECVVEFDEELVNLKKITDEIINLGYKVKS